MFYSISGGSRIYARLGHTPTYYFGNFFPKNYITYPEIVSLSALIACNARRCSHLLLDIDFTIDLCCKTLVVLHCECAIKQN